jgi:signal transduction histidine kinase
MAGGVVHDFSNALMSVIGYSDMLLQNAQVRADENSALEYLRIINTAGRDGAHLVSRLRDFYRPRGAGDLLEPVALNEIVTESIALSRPRGAKRDAKNAVTFDTDLAPNVTAIGNAADLRQVLTNLVFNALDAIPGAGAITLRTRSDPRNALIEVIDTGTGMSAEVRERCLEPFFTTKGEDGTGLGLAMVFGIIQRHQGMLEIDSEVGKGTTFRICLPAAESTVSVKAAA